MYGFKKLPSKNERPAGHRETSEILSSFIQGSGTFGLTDLALYCALLVTVAWHIGSYNAQTVGYLQWPGTWDITRPQLYGGILGVITSHRLIQWS